MVISERIQKYIQKLPPALQSKVLDYVEYLLPKIDQEAGVNEEQDWAGMSLDSAMRGMEDENIPVNTLSNVKVLFG